MATINYNCGLSVLLKVRKFYSIFIQNKGRNMDNFINTKWLQHCGDTLLVIKKSNKAGAWECEFQKYPYKVTSLKRRIIEGGVNNPLIEENEFIGKIFKQNCGDDLKIIKKTTEKNSDGSYLYCCQFLKYPYEILISDKKRIKEGKVNNPLIEENEFIGKEFPQNCGDVLKVLEKTTQKQGDFYLYHCQFVKYPCEVLCLKGNIIKKQIVNPQIEKIEFVDKIWPQHCGDDIKILKKSDIKEGSSYLWKYKFLKYSYEGMANKSNIKKGMIDNPNLPWKSKENFENFLGRKNKLFTLKELSEEFKLSHHTICNLINEYDLRKYIEYYPTVSSYENEIFNYIKEIYNKEVVQSEWSLLLNKEIDIYIPELKLGIEYNGNYWHSELFKKPNYHQEKSLLAQNEGIKLIHIWEWEWEENKNKIIKFFRDLLNKKIKIGARNCLIKEIKNEEYNIFCENNHLQGKCSAKIKIGLFYKEELVQIMSFDSPRFTDKLEWEIIRECSKQGLNIIGGKEKLWKYFVRNYNPNSVISYCDFSKFTGESYLKLGFKQERLNKPGFVWWDKKENIIYPRSPWKHSEMKSKYLKIHDCGQLVFVWSK